MKLLIDIDENTYRQAKEENDYEVIYDGYEIARAIINGIPYEEKPTVNCKDCDGYEAGYSAGLKDAERPQGEWIEVEDTETKINGYCSNCGWESKLYEEDILGMPFCPNCGADMRTKKIQVPSCLTNIERYEELLERYKEE